MTYSTDNRKAPEPRTGGDALAAQLVAAGVTTVFGVPGIQLDYFVDGIAKQEARLSFTSCRHEQGAAYMADGYARATGKPGVVTVVPGPGVLNAGAALATAYSCSSPVVCVAGQIATHAIGKGLGLLHDLPGQTDILRAVTKHTATAGEPTALPGAVWQAIGMAQSGRPRPVAVEVPDTVLKSSFSGSVITIPPVIKYQAVDADAITLAAQRLSTARRPVIYAGWGVIAANAAASLAELAATLRAPVVMSQNGRGALSDHSPWALTSLGGRKVLPEADVIIVVGSRGRRMDGASLFDPTTATIRINADAHDLNPPDDNSISVLGDAEEGLRKLVSSLAPSRSEWTTDEMSEIRAFCEAQVDGLGELAEYVRALRAGIPENGVLVGELTQTAYAARVAYPVYEPRTNLSAGYMGTLGYGLPTAIGAKRGRPDRPVVSISGDGGFAFAFAELLTAVQYDIGVVAVVFNDNAYGNVLRTQVEEFDGRVLGTRLHNPDFPTLAKALGVRGERAGSPGELQGLLTDAILDDAPTLIEVPVGPFQDPGPLVRV